MHHFGSHISLAGNSPIRYCKKVFDLPVTPVHRRTSGIREQVAGTVRPHTARKGGRDYLPRHNSLADCQLHEDFSCILSYTSR